MDRLVRRRGPGPGGVRGGRPAPGRPEPVGDRGQAFLRRLLQRDAVAALPRRHRAAAVPPPVVGGVRGRQPALRAGRGGTGGAGGDRVGARLPASAGPADAARAARRRPDRLLQPHPVPRLRDLRPASVAAAGGRGPARRRPARLPAPRRRHELPAGLPPGRRPGHQGVHRAGGRAGRPTRGPGRRVPDLYRREGPGRDRPAGRRPHADQGDQGGGGRAEPDAAGGGPARLHQGHPAPVARLRRAAGRRAARDRGRC